MKNLHNIDEMLNEIYQVDPSLKHKEDKLRQLISDLLAIKPETPFTDNFKQELKNHLIIAINQSKTYTKTSIFSQIKFWAGSIATLSIFVFALFYYQQTKQRNNQAIKPNNLEIATITQPESKPNIQPKKSPTILPKQTRIKEQTLEPINKAPINQQLISSQTDERTSMTLAKTTTMMSNSTPENTSSQTSDIDTIYIIKTMLTDHNINLSNYGNPIIKKGIPSADYTLIIFPFLVNNESVTDENGNTKGIRVNIQVSNQHIEWIKEDGTMIYNGSTETRLR